MTTKRLTRGRAIRAFCIECMGGDPRLPRDCTVTRCPLWTYRVGVEEATPDLERTSMVGARRPSFAGADVAHTA